MSADWADEEACRINNRIAYSGNFHSDELGITSALRAAFLRGRIAGLREAGVLADTHLASIRGSGLKGGEPNAYESACKQISDDIRVAADKLEKGEGVLP